MRIQRDVSESRHDFAFIAGVVVGAIAGALATLALTPMSGPDTREKLREHAGDLGPVRERAASVAGAAQQRATSMAGSAQQMVASGRAKAADLVTHTSLSTPERHHEHDTNHQEQETDRMMEENPTNRTPANSHSVHPEEPAEGRADVPADGGDTDLAPGEVGSGRTPHASDPAEGRDDVPPHKDKLDSGSNGG